MKCQNCSHKFIVQLEDSKTITIRKETDYELRDLILRIKEEDERIKTYDDLILVLIEAYREKYKDRLDIALH